MSIKIAQMPDNKFVSLPATMLIEATQMPNELEGH